jgi:hypothetical protein
MSKKRTLVLINPRDPEDPSAGNAPLGTERELCDKLAQYNTAADGAEVKRHGTMVLFGPGFTIEYAKGHDEITQAMVIVNNMDFGYPVLSRMCRALGWKMQDTESGQIFG